MIKAIVSFLEVLLNGIAVLITISCLLVGSVIGEQVGTGAAVGALLGAVIGFAVAAVFLAVPAMLLRINQNLDHIRVLLAAMADRNVESTTVHASKVQASKVPASKVQASKVQASKVQEQELALLGIRHEDGKYFVREFSFDDRDDAVAKARDLAVQQFQEGGQEPR